MRDGVQRDPTEIARGVVPEPIGGPGMHELMDRDRDDEGHKVGDHLIGWSGGEVPVQVGRILWIRNRGNDVSAEDTSLPLMLAGYLVIAAS